MTKKENVVEVTAKCNMIISWLTPNVVNEGEVITVPESWAKQALEKGQVSAPIVAAKAKPKSKAK